MTTIALQAVLETFVSNRDISISAYTGLTDQPGGTALLKGGNGTSSGDGGALSLSGGDAGVDGGAGGSVQIAGGVELETGTNGASLTIEGGGTQVTNRGGSLLLRGGNGVQEGGPVSIVGGNVGAGGTAGGIVEIQGGNTSANGQTAGYVRIKGGGSFELDMDGSAITLYPPEGDVNNVGILLDLVNGKNLLIANLPTSDPLYAGMVWNDAGVLKISAGI